MRVFLSAGKGLVALVWLAVSASHAFAQVADVQITKFGPSSALGGTAASYALEMDNNGPNAADGARFEDILPPGLTNVTAVCSLASGGAACPADLVVANGVVSGTLSTFPNLGKVRVEIHGRFGVTGPSTLSNTATISAPAGVSDPIPGSNSSSISTAMRYDVDLSVTKTQSSDSYQSGVPLTYTITLRNKGAGAADGIKLIDRLSNSFISHIGADLVFNQCSASGGAQCPDSASFPNRTGQGQYSPVFDATIPALPAGGELVITYTMTPYLLPSASCGRPAGQLFNKAAIQLLDDMVDSNPYDNEQTAILQVPGTPDCVQTDLQVRKSQEPPVPSIGDLVTYTMTLTNAGPLAADGATIGDVIRSHGGSGSYLDVAAQFDSCTAALGAVCPADSEFLSPTGSALYATLFNTQVPVLPVNGQLTIVYQVQTRFNSTVPCGRTLGGLNNEFSAGAPAGMNDSDISNNRASVPIIVPASQDCAPADLVVNKTQSSDVYQPGVPVDYTMTVTNVGTTAADGAIITDRLITFELAGRLDVQSSAISCTAAGGAVCPPASDFPTPYSGSIGGFSWPFQAEVPKLPAGGSLTIQYALTYGYSHDSCAWSSGYLVNEFSAGPPTGMQEDTPWNNTSTTTMERFSCSNVSVNKSVNPVTASSGAVVTYAVDLHNAGPSDTSNVVFSDPLPAGVEFSDASCSVLTAPAQCGAAVSYDPATRTVSSVVPTLGNGGAVRFVIRTTAGTQSGTYTNTAYAAVPAGVIDPILASNESHVNLQIFALNSTRTVTKEIAGLPAGLPSAMTFSGSMVCGAQPAQTWTATVAAGATSGTSAPLSFVAGDSCTATENTPPSAPAGYAWTGEPEIVEQAQGFTVTNRLHTQPLGSVRLTKQISGPAAGVAAVNGAFDFSLDCGVDGIHTGSVSVANGQPASVQLTGLPLNAVCMVTETGKAAAPAAHHWDAPIYSANPVVVSGNEVALSVINPLVGSDNGTDPVDGGSGGAKPHAVPVGSPWAYLALAAMIAGLGMARRRRMV
jgi:uncharacterized repeat protein (TIGR01451 family)